MGLSKKLGGGSGNTRGAAEIPDHAIDYTWSTQAYTMREILTRFRLPCVVKCSGDAGAVLWADFRFDMRQPFLLHAARTVRKIHARSLKTGGSTPGDMVECGPPLAIPEDYDGWFFPVGRRDPTVLPRHTRVEGAASSPSRQVLVTTPLPAFTPVKVPDGLAVNKHVKHEVGVGEVLTKVGVTKGEPISGGGGGSASPGTALRFRARQSLRCVDENQHEVIIPFNHRALLYDVAENYGVTPTHTPTLRHTALTTTTTTNTNNTSAQDDPSSLQSSTASLPGKSSPSTKSKNSLHPSSPTKSTSSLQPPQQTTQGVSGVVHTRTIISTGNAALPRVFRHVLGDLPAISHAFTGILRCYSVFTEETVMAATMSRNNLALTAKNSTSCLELATECTAKFNIALNESELRRTNQYCLALKMCEELAPCYVRSIKTSFTIRPVVSVLDGVDLSMYANGKESGPGNKESEFFQRNLPGDEEDYESDEQELEVAPIVKGSVSKNPLYRESPPESRKNQHLSHDEEHDKENKDRKDLSQRDAKKYLADEDPDDKSVISSDVRDNESIVAHEDNGSVITDDVRDLDNESLTTEDDIDDSIMDTASITETITSEVDANSEFDISWGQLKRARSFSGSISTLTDSNSQSTTSLNTDSDDDSVVNHGHLDSFATPRSTINRNNSDGEFTQTRDTNSTVGTNSSRGTNSSTSEDTVVLRASAPSPVYANIPKKDKLSVFNETSQMFDEIIPNEVSSFVEGTLVVGSQTSAESSASDFNEGKERESGGNSDSGLLFPDNSVRSVWNITPTIDDAKNVSHTRDIEKLGNDRLHGTTSEGNEQPICWGDTLQPSSELLIDSEEAILEVHQKRSKESLESSTLERLARTSMRSALGKQIQPRHGDFADDCDGFMAAQQPLSAQSSTSSQSTINLHPDLSAKSSASTSSSLSAAYHQDNSASVHQQGIHQQLSARLSSGSTNSYLSVGGTHHPQLSAQSSSAGSDTTVVGHPRLSAKLSAGSSTGSVQSSQFPAHTVLSSRSSVQSEGTAQDMAILRLEQALNDATTFLKGGGAIASANLSSEAFPPRKGPTYEKIYKKDISGQENEDACVLNDSQKGAYVMEISDSEATSDTSFEPSVSSCVNERLPLKDFSKSSLSRGAQNYSRAKPTPAPRRGREGVDYSEESCSSVDRTPQNSSRNSLRKNEDDDMASAGLSLSNITSIPSLTGHRAAETVAENKSTKNPRKPALDFTRNKTKTAGYNAHDFAQDRARQKKVGYYQSDTQLFSGPAPAYKNQAQHASDSRIDASQSNNPSVGSRTAQGQTESQQAESQIDLDFVKALGDRLISVSRKTSLPKYQRLLHDKDQPSDSESLEGQDGPHHFQKKKQGQRVSVQNSALKHAQESDSVGSNSPNKDTVLEDLDLLHEEIV